MRIRIHNTAVIDTVTDKLAEINYTESVLSTTSFVLS